MSSMGNNESVKSPQVIHLDTNAVENIRTFRRQWELYSRTTGIDKLNEEVKTSALYSLMGEPACSLADNLLLQRVAENSSADSILSALENHFSSPANVLYERYVFNRIEQNVDESVHNFANRVWHQAAKCDFRDHTYDFVRDRFIVGLANENLRNFLLTKNFSTFEDVYNLSTVVEEDEDNVPPNATLKVHSPLSIRLPQPSCPSEELVLSACSRSPAMENARSGAFPLLPSDSQLFPSRNCPMYQSVAPSQMCHSRPPQNQPEIGSQHSGSMKENPPRPVEDAKEEPPRLQRDTSSLKKFAVGTYVVLKRDLKSARADLSIWRVCSPSFLQEFTPYVSKNGLIEYINYGVCITHTDRRWLSSKEKYYLPVAIANETVKLDFFGRQVTTVRLKEDIFKCRKMQTVENARNAVDPLRDEIASDRHTSKNISKLKKTASGRVKKMNKKQKIRHQICLSLASLMCCCA